jgi:hypothetical protein
MEDALGLRRPKKLEREDARLRKAGSDLTLDNVSLKEADSSKYGAQTTRVR